MQKIAAWGVLVLVVGQWLWMSWLRWPDPIRDFGRELYVPWQLNQGRMLYQDLFYLYGPFSVYFNALVFRLLGTSITALVAVNFLLLAGLSGLIFSLFRFLAGFWAAYSALLIFLGIFAFGQYTDVGNYNYICPYAHGVVHGLILSFLALIVLKQWLLRPSVLGLIILGLLWGLVFLTKFEVFLALTSALAVTMLLHGWMTKELGTSVRRMGLIVLIFGLFFWIFPKPLTAGKLLEIIFNRYAHSMLSPASTGYYGNLSGFNTLWANVTLVLESALGYMLAVFALVFVSGLVSRVKDKLSRQVIVGVLAGLIVIAGFFLTSDALWLLFRPLPLILVIMMLVTLRALFRKSLTRHEAVKNLLLLSIIIFSFVLLFKIFLNVHVYHYGFALAMPGALLLAGGFVYYIPLLGRGKWYAPSVCRLLGLALLMAGIIGHFKWANYYYSRKDHAVGRGYDTMLAWNPHVFSTPSMMSFAIDWIQKNTRSTDTVVTIPEGAMINFLSRRKNPMQDIEFMPNMKEEKIIESFQKVQPNFVVVVFRDMSEYGAAFFGKDYGTKVDQWIQDHYSMIFYMQAPTKAGLEFVTILMRGKRPSSSFKETEVILR
ncbi:MAG: hypothetical protein HQL14_03705 [Candidatus Omnitrophica bacterium]|nr:hypothetical protein [Candidatus Omnitrophota bacterium]